MTLTIWFWILMILSLIFGFWNGRAVTPAGQSYTYRVWGSSLLIFVLLVLLGWKVFGGHIQ